MRADVLRKEGLKIGFQSAASKNNSFVKLKHLLFAGA